MIWKHREFRCKHGFVKGQNCPDCKVPAPPERRQSVQQSERFHVPKGYGPPDEDHERPSRPPL